MKAGATLFKSILTYIHEKMGEATGKDLCVYVGKAPDGLKTAPFYLMLGECETRVWRSATFDGETHRFEVLLHIYGEQDTLKINECAYSLIDLLEGVDLPLEGHVLIELQFEKMFHERLSEKGGHQSRLLFTAITVADGVDKP